MFDHFISILCMKLTFLSIKDHTIFDRERSNNLYRALKNAVLKKILARFSSKKLNITRESRFY